jgi:hypothetical protein
MTSRIPFGFVALLTLAGGAPAHGQSIGIFFDRAGTICGAQVGPTPLTTLYVLAYPGGAAANGIHGVQFRIAGIPATWNQLNTGWSGATGAITLGNPLFTWMNGTTPTVGAAVALGACRGDGLPEDDVPPVLVGTLQLLLAPTPNDVHLRIDRMLPYLNPEDPECPFVIIDCIPVPPPPLKICASGGELFLNPTGPDCSVAVQHSSWSRIKNLYAAGW